MLTNVEHSLELQWLAVIPPSARLTPCHEGLVHTDAMRTWYDTYQFEHTGDLHYVSCHYFTLATQQHKPLQVSKTVFNHNMEVAHNLNHQNK